MEFVRLTQPAMMAIVPHELYELDDDTFTSDDLRRIFPTLMTDPATFLFGVVEDAKVVGLYWARRNDLSNRLVVYGMSMLREFQKTGGENIEAFKELSRKIVEANDLKNTVELYSNHSKIAERYGLKPARTVIMEWTIETQTLSGESGAEPLEKVTLK
jgi:hypothetical protein